jgi:hypothetical protein
MGVQAEAFSWSELLVTVPVPWSEDFFEAPTVMPRPRRRDLTRGIDSAARGREREGVRRG